MAIALDDVSCLRNLIKKCLHEVLDERAAAALPKLEEVHTIHNTIRATAVRSDPNDPLFVNLDPGQYLLLGVEEVGDEEHALISFPDGSEHTLVVSHGNNPTPLGFELFGE